MARQSLAEASALFVGRQREIDLLRGGCARLANGTGSLWLLSGEAGIGKTRLARELAGEAKRAGARVFWGRCWEVEGTPAFWPWTEVLRAYLREPSAALDDLGDAAATAIAQIVPELQSRRGRRALPTAEGAAGRFRLFDAVTTLVRGIASERPLVIILDDLHTADPSSLLLLQFLARRVEEFPALLIGTYRTERRALEPVASLLHALARHGHPIALGGLARDEVAALVQALTGAPPSRAMLDAFLEQTQGNPFFVREATHQLAAVGQATARPRGLPLSDQARALMRLRFDGLSAACVGALTLAAVLGREFDQHVLHAAWNRLRPGPDREAGSGSTELPQAVAAGLIEPVDALTDRYRFSHALVRETLYRDCESTQRAAMHRAVGETLEELRRVDPDVGLAELAHHFVYALPLGELDKAIDCTVQAGQEAQSRLAFEQAQVLFTTALRLLTVEPAVAPAGPTDEGASVAGRRCVLLLALGDSQTITGDPQRRTTYRHAADLARALGAPVLFAQAALGLAGLGDIDPSVDEDTVALLEEALGTLGEHDTALRARLLTRLALQLYFSEARPRIESLSAEAVAVAERVGDPVTLGVVLGDRHLVLWGPDAAAERRQIARRIIELGRKHRCTNLALIGHHWSAVDCLESANVVAAKVHRDRYAGLAAELRQPFDLWEAEVLQAGLLLLAGRFEDAERQIAHALTLGQREQIPNAALVATTQSFYLRSEVGGLEQLAGTLGAMTESLPHLAIVQVGRMLLHALLGELDAARPIFELMAGDALPGLPRDANWFAASTALAYTCWALDDSESARRLYDQLLPCAQQVAMVGFAGVCAGAVTHYLGLLAACLRRWGDAERHFRAARRTHERMAAPALVARTLLRHAETLLRHAADQERAAALLETAVREYDALGESVFGRHARSLFASLGGKTHTGTLTGVEPAGRAEQEFCHEGDVWTLSYGRKTVRLRDVKGLQHLALLLGDAGREFHVIDLAKAAYGQRHAETARQRQLAGLRDQLGEAEAQQDLLRAGRIREAMEQVTEQLGVSYRIRRRGGGRDRELENSRKAVNKAIRVAMAKIQKVHAPLWRHLRASVRTGTYCCYRPETPIQWALDGR
jgi:tetratricopeptide (TPR) repeat protein